MTNFFGLTILKCDVFHIINVTWAVWTLACGWRIASKTKRPLFREEQVLFVSLSQNKRKALLKEKRFFAG